MDRIIVILAAIYLLGLGVACLAAPARARHFLGLFAGSARAHYTEVVLRLVMGIALVAHAPAMRCPQAFLLFGWIIVISSGVLLLLPWRWHQRFAQMVVTPVTRFVWLFGVVSLLLGGTILWAVTGS